MSKLPSVRQSEFDRMRRRLGFAFLALLLLMFGGTVGYKWIGGPDHGFIDAFYMTVITFSAGLST